MDAIKAVQFYLNRMLSDVPGMKVLLLDDETTTIISLAYTQSQLLAKEVFLIDKLSNVSREKMKHMKCVCFLRPMDDAIQAVIDELRDPKYMKYYLYFTNTLRKSSLERLAEADEFEAVCEVQEYYADYLAINPTLCALPLLGPEHPLTGEQPQVWDARALNRSVEGVLAILLSLKKKPLIRYERQSPLAKKVASEVQYQIGQEGQLFDFRKADTPPILLIVDRMSDPVTPLLTQWTYQAMVHELIGIVNGRVDLSYVKDARPELRDIVLSCEHDTFYRQNMFLDLGDLGANIKTYVEEYQVKHKSNMQIESITDMKRFMEDYPDFRKLSGNVTKHVTLVGELSRLVGEQQLMAVGELEQNLAAVDSHATDLRALQALLETPGIPDSAKLRLVLLYALRYERHPNSALPQLTDALARGGLSEGKMRLVADLLAAARPEQRAEDHGDPADVFARTKH
ncbi:Sec1-like protein, partial [Caulochytrium protostelioides]